MAVLILGIEREKRKQALEREREREREKRSLMKHLHATRKEEGKREGEGPKEPQKDIPTLY